MILFILFIGIVIVIAAVRNTQGDLAAALMTDIPAFVVWAAAILGVGMLGFVPGLKPVSRALLALVLVVLILKNYKAILSGFANAWQHPPSAGASAKPSGNFSSGSGGSGGGGFGLGDFNLGGSGGSSLAGDYQTYAEIAAIAAA